MVLEQMYTSYTIEIKYSVNAMAPMLINWGWSIYIFFISNVLIIVNYLFYYYESIHDIIQ